MDGQDQVENADGNNLANQQEADGGVVPQDNDQGAIGGAGAVPEVPPNAQDLPAAAPIATGTHLIQAVTVKLPDFWKSRPALWFRQVEAKFALARPQITVEKTRYYHVVAALPEDVAVQVTDLLEAPVGATPYTTLKAAIIKRLGKASEEKSRLALYEEQLGDASPSNFLRRLQTLVDQPVFDSDLFRFIFINKMPESMRPLLAMQTDIPISTLAEKADALLAFHKAQPLAVQAITTQQRTSAPPPSADALEETTDSVAALRANNSGFRGRGRGRGFFRGNNPRGGFSNQGSQRPQPPPGLCYYHWRFGEKAYQCTPPCKFQKN